jgi:hypothetical protein
VSEKLLPNDGGDMRARPADQALAVPVEPVSRLDPPGLDPSRGYDMESAPKDCAVLAWCSPDCRDPKCGFHTGEGTSICLYHAHAEGGSAYGLGFAIVEWGGGWDDRTYEYPNEGWLPDWWFRFGSEFEEVANPVRWWPLPALATEAGTAETLKDGSVHEGAGPKDNAHD